MKIKIERVTSWQRAVDAARFTVRKDSLDKEPSDRFKMKLIMSEHSPLYLVEYDIKMFDVPEWVHVHLIRHHIGVTPFVSTQRPDRTGDRRKREELSQAEPLNLQLSLNAMAIINMSRKRLCSTASKETREIWSKVLAALYNVDPLLVRACVPNCVYRGFCPEYSSCGFCQSAKFRSQRNSYMSNLNI